jgi:hypothetical protein
MSPKAASPSAKSSGQGKQLPQTALNNDKPSPSESVASLTKSTEEHAHVLASPAKMFIQFSHGVFALSPQLNKGNSVFASDILRIDGMEPPPSATRSAFCIKAPLQIEGQPLARNATTQEFQAECRYLYNCHFSVYLDGYKVPFNHLPPYEEQWLNDQNLSNGTTKGISKSTIPHNTYRWLLGTLDSPHLMTRFRNPLILRKRRELRSWLARNNFSCWFINRCNISIHTNENSQCVMDIHWPNSTICDAPELRPVSGPIFEPADQDGLNFVYQGHGPRCAPYEITIKVHIMGNDNIIDFKDTFNAAMSPFGAVIVDVWKMCVEDSEVSHSSSLIEINDFQWNGTLILLVALYDRSTPHFEKPSLDPFRSACELPDSVRFHGQDISLHHLCEKYPNESDTTYGRDSVRAMCQEVRNGEDHSKVDKAASKEMEAQTAIRLVEAAAIAANVPPGGNYFFIYAGISL